MNVGLGWNPVLESGSIGNARKVLGTTVLLLMLVAAAVAGPAPQLVAPTEKAAFEALLRTQALDADARYSGSRCDSAQIEHLQAEDVKIGDRPDLAAAREKMRVVGCGRSHVENVAVARLGGDPPWKMVAGLPGDPLAEMALQQTVASQVIRQVSALGPAGCTATTLDDIYVAARPGHVRFPNLNSSSPTPKAKFAVSMPDALLSQRDALDASAAWVEVWPLSSCGVAKLTGVVFVPYRTHQASAFFIVPLWEQVQANGSGAQPAKDPAS